MKHNLSIYVSKNPPEGGIVQCRNVPRCEKLLTRRFGKKGMVMILFPGDKMEMVSITEVPKGGVAVE